MHEWVETGISAVLLAIILAVVISFVVPNKVKERSARQTEVRKLQRQAQEEAERFGQESTLEYTSMLQSNKNCAICLNLSTRRCSRCKAVRYCSETCQVQHWRQGHKHECREPVRVAAAKATAKVADSTPPPPKVEVLPQEAVVPQEPVVLPKEDPVVPVAAVGEPATESVEAVAPEAGVSPPPAPASEPVPVPDPAPPTAPAPEEVPALAPAAAPVPESPPPPPVPTPAAEPTPAPAPSPAPADPPAAVAASTSETKPSEAAAEPEAAAASAAPSDGKLAKPKKILFPYEVFVKFFNWDILRHPPCGLINCGNSCFANVVLQCLTYTRPLTAYLLEGAHGEDCQRNDWCFMCELQNHVRRVKQSQNPFSPIRILSRIRNIGNHLGYGRQEDAHEFMRFAIDSMQSICLDEHGGEKAVDPRTQETTLIHHIFGGHLQSQVKCMQCQHESNRYESMMDLAVEIQGFVESLEDALAQFTAPECLDGDNKYKCDRCNAYVKARKRLTIHEAPNILTVALKRFQSGKFGKLNKRVTFPEVLDISPYMSATEDASPISYQLYAAVVHVDMLNASFFGHYICYVKNSQGSWYKIDDSKVKEVDLDKVLAQKAYMLFYTRSSARPAPLTDFESRCVTAFPRVQFLDEKSFPLSNGHLVSGSSSPTVRVFPNKVPGVMQAITETLGNGTVQTVGEGHGSSWIQDVGTIVATDVISPWTGDVEMVSTSADESPDDDRTQQNVQSGQSSMVSMDANNHASKEELISSYRPFVSPEQLLTTKAGKRRLDAGLSPLPPVRGLDTDGFPSWPAGNHSRSSSCPSALVATSDCIMSSSSLTKDVTSVWATESMESDNHTVDVGYNQNGTSAFDSGGSTSPGLATDTFQVELLARAKRQHLESRPVLGLGHLDISRKSQLSNSSTDLGCLDMEVDELESISEAKSPGPVSACAISDASGFEQLSESSSGTQMEGVEMWGSRLAVDGTSRALSNFTSSSPLCSEGAGKDSKVGHNLPSPDEVSSVAHEVSGHLGAERVTEASGMPGQQETTTVMVEDKLWKPNNGNGDGVVGGNSDAVVAPKRVGIQRKTKLKPLFTPGFLNRPQSSKKLSCPSKRKTGEDGGSRLLAEQSAGPQSVIHDADIDEMQKCGAGSSIVDGNGTGDTAGGCYGDQAGSVLPGPEGKGRSVRGSANGKRIPPANGAGLEAPVVPAKERKNNVSSNGVSAPGIEAPGVPIKESASHHSGTKALGTRAKQGRNAICACGSQRKWKKCCGKADGTRTGSRPVGT